jgi:hypothetical protein
MPKPKKKIPLWRRAPCPCGSGLIVEQCCLDPIDDQLRKPVPSLVPPPPKTGFSHQRCYLKDTGDCSTQISSEHYMSAAILAQLGDAIRISGVRWLPEGHSKKLSIGSFSANILCKRHNEALSPLDAEAAIFFATIRRIADDLAKVTLSRKPQIHLISGQTLELWMLKLACGIFFGGGSVDRQKITENHNIDLAKIHNAFFKGEWDPLGGLYQRVKIGEPFAVNDTVQAGPLVNSERMYMVGALTTLSGMQLECVFDTFGLPGDPGPTYVRRPSELIWHGGARLHALMLSWPIGTPLKKITIARKS